MALLYLTSILFISSVSGLLPQLLSQLNTQGQGKQCFFNGRWYPPGTILNAGRSGSWCFGAYCDFDGMIKFWDDYNCPQSSNNSPPFPDISVLLKSAGANVPKTTTTTTTAATTTTTTTTTPKPTVRPTLFPYPFLNNEATLFPIPPSTTPTPTMQPLGCLAPDGRFYWPGQDINNFQRGRRCSGTYCDWNSKIQTWEDFCPITPPPAPVRQAPAGPGAARGPTTVDYT